jgi:hypothetical protein
MSIPTRVWTGPLMILAVVGAVLSAAHESPLRAQARSLPDALRVPQYEVDAAWPKQPGNWMIGSIGGLNVDPVTDHLWVANRPRSLDNDETYAVQGVGECCVPAPPILQFDVEGNLLSGWGGPGPGYEWPVREHGIFFDGKGNVWLGGAGDAKLDHQLLIFTKGGRFVRQLGRAGKSQGSNDLENFGGITKGFYHAKTNEMFLCDGEYNRRVIVVDADTGQYKRYWGAYGNKPDDTAPNKRTFVGDGAPQFNTVHSILISHDDIVYVSEHSGNRIQLFKPDGTFIKEVWVDRKVATPTGTTLDLVFSPDKEQQFIFASGGDQQVRILRRDTLEVVGRFGRLGHYPGQFLHLHALAIDSKWNIYTGENTGKRIQKFVVKGYASPLSATQ